MNQLSIKVNIAGRTYPLTVKTDEAENVREAETLINKKLKEYEQSYAVRDKQDLIAMSALQLAVQNLTLEKKLLQPMPELTDKLSQLEMFISEHLKNSAETHLQK
ncbi:MAG TPA: cell division protein ZapA [Bacteroidia bacterium]|nr:cell division protein ZapA [Bacteroidia bacterium]